MDHLLKEFTELVGNVGSGLGWLRAVAQCYNYRCSKIDFGSNFQNNLKSCCVNLGWGLDGSARCRKVTVTVAFTFS